MSYDVDGDGNVSVQDYYFAKQFDSNNDGILEEHERVKCLTALKSGFEQQLRLQKSKRNSLKKIVGFPISR